VDLSKYKIMPSLPSPLPSSSHRRNASAGGASTPFISFEETKKTLIAINQSLFEQTKMTLIELNQSLLNSSVDLNYDTYDLLSSNDMSCIGPETNHNIVIGKEFHKYYFDVFSSNNIYDVEGETGMAKVTKTKVTMVKPHVQIMCDGNAAVISYVRLTQQTSPGKPPVTTQQSETRVWEKRNNEWVNVHFHKSDYKS
jgi:hypothetical protein